MGETVPLVCNAGMMWCPRAKERDWHVSETIHKTASRASEGGSLKGVTTARIKGKERLDTGLTLDTGLAWTLT